MIILKNFCKKDHSVAELKMPLVGKVSIKTDKTCILALDYMKYYITLSFLSVYSLFLLIQLHLLYSYFIFLDPALYIVLLSQNLSMSIISISNIHDTMTPCFCILLTDWFCILLTDFPHPPFCSSVCLTA